MHRFFKLVVFAFLGYFAACIYVCAQENQAGVRFLRQQIDDRESYSLLGPVQELITEVANVTLNPIAGGFVEGPRKLTTIYRFNSAGYQTEKEIYDIGGGLNEKTYYYQDDQGRTIRTETYDAQGELMETVTFSYNGDGYLAEEIHRDAAENVTERWILSYTGNMVVIEQYDGADNLVAKQEIHQLSDVNSEIYLYDENGDLESKSVYQMEDNRVESWHYDENLQLLTHIIVQYDDRMNPLEQWTYDENGTLATHMFYSYDELDEYQNWVKRTQSMAMPETIFGFGNRMPVSAEYRTITYFTSVDDFILY